MNKSLALIVIAIISASLAYASTSEPIKPLGKFKSAKEITVVKKKAKTEAKKEVGIQEMELKGERSKVKGKGSKVKGQEEPRGGLTPILAEGEEDAPYREGAIISKDADSIAQQAEEELKELKKKKTEGKR